MEVHQQRFVDSAAFVAEFAASRSDFAVGDVATLTTLGNFVAARQDFAGDANDARRFLAIDGSSQMNAEEDFIYAQSIKLESDNCCSSCDTPIFERTLLTANGRSFHEQCLRCCDCSSPLHSQPSCFSRANSIFCRNCYLKQYGAKCASCDRVIHANDWVRRARSLVFHLACFLCQQCKRQLSTGEEFALQDSRLLCKQHYVELVEGDCTSQQKQKTKRVRTTFAEEQLQILQDHFRHDSNPDGADLERIANMTGLSKRVTQVWFQNSRARQKKYQTGHKSDGDGNSRRSSQEPGSPTQKSEGSSDGGFPHSDNSLTVPSSCDEAMAESTVALASLQYE